MECSQEILRAINDLREKIEIIDDLREKIETLIDRRTIKEFYTTKEFAALVGQEPKTIRDNLAAGRLRGVKRRDGHGRSKTWSIPHAELERYRREGLLDPREQPTHRQHQVLRE